MGRRKLSRVLVLTLGAVLLLAAHGIALGLVSVHMAVPTTVVAGVIVAAIVKHLGLISAVAARLRRRSRSARKDTG